MTLPAEFDAGFSVIPEKRRSTRAVGFMTARAIEYLFRPRRIGDLPGNFLPFLIDADPAFFLIADGVPASRYP